MNVKTVKKTGVFMLPGFAKFVVVKKPARPAREGINLQTYCSDLIHFDLPWNPSRLEQRNGRIDRKLQPAPTY